MTTTTAQTRRVYSPVQKDAATFIETVEESGGTRTVLDVEVAPGGGNGLHTHSAFSETFECLEGTLTVRLGDTKLSLAPGETAVAPVGALHCFANETDETVRFRCTLAPGHRGFEQALQVVYGLAEDGRVRADGTPYNVLHLALLMQWSDTSGPGFMRVVEKVLKPLAALARRRGVDTELIERYCRY